MVPFLPTPVSGAVGALMRDYSLHNACICNDRSLDAKGDGRPERSAPRPGPAGGPGPAPGSGYGLIGMRERVGLHGGSLETGRREGRGYRVTARLPLPDEEGALR
ncbi:ATP-binding protein [Streptomyces clavuligerus]|uniref:Histidine kinase n=1 Tax=Streptomyces clavuligerus TaxID=1901 RepID=B5GYG2_STRCL|nr:histidine kinase [Streptomyces clavuligerus]AXU11542.1 ATP-binding protein [Streptomyces clavuligerus]EDY51358.1 hypothetical protein SSCG_04516 [Streptomyces clavuligerus]EFG10457.1 Histidine kinase [Streptomyces clavuligerus]MBY6301362.1 ATP-binding protein [Streptomyces clavuligerus]